MKKIVAVSMMLVMFISLHAQVGIGTTTPNSSAALDVSSTTKGLLMPRVTQQQRQLIANPATGLIVYQTDGQSGFYYNSGSQENPTWLLLGTGNSAGSVGQSSSTVYGTNAIFSEPAAPGYVLLPGLSQTVNVPANSILVVQTTGGVINAGGASPAIVDIAIFIDGIEIPTSGYRRRIIVPSEYGSHPAYWSMSVNPVVAPGTHTITVMAKNVQNHSFVSNNHFGASTLDRQGLLTVMILKQ